jgi:tetratricopeptide (TPR) repeat protein
VYLQRQKTRKLYILITIVITLYFPTGCGRAPEPENPAPGIPEQQITETLNRAEELFKQREDVDKLREARTITGQLRNPNVRDYEAEWKFAKYSVFLGQQLTDADEKEKIFEEGRDAGKRASRIQPDKPDGYFWYGANLGELAKLSPVTVGYSSVDDNREAMNKVIEIDPGYQGASAYDVLAQVEFGTRLFGGKSSKAAEYLEKAVTIEKNNSQVRLHLAQAYLDIDKEDKAKEQLEYIVKMQPPPDYLPEHKAAVEKAKKLLATRFN